MKSFECKSECYCFGVVHQTCVFWWVFFKLCWFMQECNMFEQWTALTMKILFFFLSFIKLWWTEGVMWKSYALKRWRRERDGAEREIQRQRRERKQCFVCFKSLFHSTYCMLSNYCMRIWRKFGKWWNFRQFCNNGFIYWF